jgi:hypothetical protein
VENNKTHNMPNKTVGALIILAITVSVLSSSAINCFQPKADSNPNPQTHLTNQPQLQTYIGFLISFNYTSQLAKSSELTHLIFENKTFTYTGHLSLENGNIYNVTYFTDTPEQAISIVNTSTKTQ